MAMVKWTSLILQKSNRSSRDVSQSITALLLTTTQTRKGPEKQMLKSLKLKMVFIWHMVPAMVSQQMSICCWVLIWFFFLPLVNFSAIKGICILKFRAGGIVYSLKPVFYLWWSPIFMMRRKLIITLFGIPLSRCVQCTSFQNNGQRLSHIKLQSWKSC